MPDRTHHSEEAQEVLGRIPGWIVRRGIMLIFIIFLGIAIGCYFIKYPQTVEAPVVITTIHPPADLIVRANGRIDEIFKENGQQVNKGDLIAILYNTADYRSVMTVYDSLKYYDSQDYISFVNAGWLKNDYALGELQSVYAEFVRLCSDYRDYLNLGYIENKQQLIKEQIKKNRDYYRQQIVLLELRKKDHAFEYKNLERDSLLYIGNVISASDYEERQRSLNQSASSRISQESSLTATELTILQMEQQLVELSIDRKNEIAGYERQLNTSRQQLISRIKEWFYQYVISSPIDGKVSFTKYWSGNQTIQTGERLATVVPTEETQVIGHLAIPSGGLGKVEAGQTVNIKLNGYPYMEYGLLKGEIVYISDIPDERGYIAEVRFPNGLITTYHKKLNLIQQMDGTGEIIVRDQRLIQRFIQPIRALFDK